MKSERSSSQIMRIISAVIILLLSTCSSCASSNGNEDYLARNYYGSEDTYDFKPVAPTEGVVGESDVLELMYSDDLKALQVRDKRSGYVWDTVFDPELITERKVNKTWQSNMMSMFNITYSDTSETGRDQIVSSSAAKLQPNIETAKILNGISLRYTFESLGLIFVAEFRVDNDTFIVTIPQEGIVEKDRMLLSIEVLPFFGAATDDEDGYIFYPDGNGALMNIPQPKTTKNPSPYSFSVYGSNSFDFDNDTIGTDSEADSSVSAAMLPVYGIKSGDKAFVAIISEAEAASVITLNPSGVGVPLNRISPAFTLRSSYNVYSSYDSRNGMPAGNPLYERIDNTMIESLREVRYMILPQESSDYSGMASRYREYLLETGGMKDKISNNSDIPMNLGLFMGTTEKRVVFDRFVAATRFDKAHEIINELTQSGINKAFVTLEGWNKDGYGAYPQQLIPERELGGKRELKELANEIDSQGWTISVELDPIDIVKSNGGFSSRNDIVLVGDGYPLQDKHGTRYVFNPAAALKRLKSELKGFERTGIRNITMSRIGSVIYEDYQKLNPMTKLDTKEVWIEVLSEMSEQFDSVLLNGGNAYVLPYADGLMQIDESDSKFLITSASIPFYQMVVHSYIPCSGNVLNLAFDENIQKLRWIEYGTMPTFDLTWESPDILRKTDYNRLFSSRYDLWKDKVTDIYKEFNTNIGNVWNSPIIKHESITENLKKVEYENGTTVYINYSERVATAGDVNIPPMDYKVVVSSEGKS